MGDLNTRLKWPVVVLGAAVVEGFVGKTGVLVGEGQDQDHKKITRTGKVPDAVGSEREREKVQSEARMPSRR